MNRPPGRNRTSLYPSAIKHSNFITAGASVGYFLSSLRAVAPEAVSPRLP